MALSKAKLHGMAAEDSIIQQQVWVVELRLGSGCRAKVRVRVWRPAEDSIIQQQVGVKVRVCRPARVWVRVHGMAAEDSIIQQQARYLVITPRGQHHTAAGRYDAGARVRDRVWS